MLEPDFARLEIVKVMAPLSSVVTGSRPTNW